MTTITIEAAIQDLQKWLSGNCGCQLRCEAGPDAKDPDFITYVAELTVVAEEDGADEQVEVGAGDTLADALIALQRSAGGHPYDAYRTLTCAGVPGCHIESPGSSGSATRRLSGSSSPKGS